MLSAVMHRHVVPSSFRQGCSSVAHRCPCVHAAPGHHTLGRRRSDTSRNSIGSSWLQSVGRVAAPLLLTSLAATSGMQFPPDAAAAGAQGGGTISALEEYLQLEESGKLGSQRALDSIRAKYNIRRSIDGRASLRSRAGTWFNVRLDLEVPGALLLRNSDNGAVFAIETSDLPQVDLSDDYVLMMIFSDNTWEDQMAPVEFMDEASGGTQQLTMTEKEFREFIGILKDFEEGPQEGR